jgi:hypothetical protein
VDSTQVGIEYQEKWLSFEMRLCVALHKPTDFSAKSSASNIRVHKLSTMIIKVSDLPVTLVHLHQAKGLHIL